MAHNLFFLFFFHVYCRKVLYFNYQFTYDGRLWNYVAKKKHFVGNSGGRASERAISCRKYTRSTGNNILRPNEKFPPLGILRHVLVYGTHAHTHNIRADVAFHFSVGVIIIIAARVVKYYVFPLS